MLLYSYRDQIEAFGGPMNISDLTNGTRVQITNETGENWMVGTVTPVDENSCRVGSDCFGLIITQEYLDMAVANGTTVMILA